MQIIESSILARSGSARVRLLGAFARRRPVGFNSSFLIVRARRISARLFLAGLAVASMVSGCERSAFVCGERYGTREDEVTRCDRPRERCVCATRRCAVQVEANECGSGYRYAREPFGDGTCVELREVVEDAASAFSDETTGRCGVGGGQASGGAGGGAGAETSGGAGGNAGGSGGAPSDTASSGGTR